ncbi:MULTISPECIES: hypothetical protein [unclassified Haladaptatus]|uniref:hypothetical protein n=1 Tax=unclassified Haladaptatus TaxID=2622732 RepID=UPI0023E83B61|nr:MULTISPECIES: hypothetical protein [unclassified Haladaptatus]
MGEPPETVSSVQQTAGPLERLVNWFLLGGNRLVVAGIFTLVVFLTFFSLVAVGVLAVGPSSVASSLFTSGLASGVLTLITVALSINQLILSRVFGSPNELRDKLDGSRTLREEVRTLAGEATTPNDPADFLSLIARTLEARANTLDENLTSTAESHATLSSYAADVAEYGANIDDAIESEEAIVDVLSVIMGTEYARNLRATEYMQNTYTADLPTEATEQLDAIDRLLEAIAVTRQFFKTLSLQQDFAQLSRFIASSGFLALVVTVLLALVYTSSGVMVAPSLLPMLVSVGLALIFVPLALFIAYTLRAATIAHRTVSVGPFIPPEERTDS